MTKSKGLSIRLKMILAFLLILGISYYAVAVSLVGSVGESLYEERRKQDILYLQGISPDCGELLALGESIQLESLLLLNAARMDTRLLISDPSGKIQFDSEMLQNGKLYRCSELEQILSGSNEESFGVHVQNQRVFPFFRTQFGDGKWDEYHSVCCCALKQEDRLVGCLIMENSVADILAVVSALQQRVALYFLGTALLSLVLIFIFTNRITGPLTALTKSIQRMGQGDLTTRVKVTGGGEIRRLSEVYNAMCDKLETLDKSRNQFVSNASHELKTPLATMKILLESIIYQPDMEDEIRSEFLNDINKEIDRLSMIIGDLLTLVSMDSQTMHLTIDNCNYAQLVKDNAHRLETFIKQRKQELTLQLGDRCEIRADSGKLSQVVYNLMENASKYTPEGGSINVRLLRSGQTVIFTVTDNGPGIPTEDQKHIFERFYRVDKARSRETGGTGLGLSIVNQMVLMHGGTVSVQSEPGKGSTFTVELPINPNIH